MAMPMPHDQASNASGSDHTAQGTTTPPAIKTAGGAYPLAPGHPLWEDLAPADSYTQEGTYWADLPRGRRTAWINRQANEEARRELKVLGGMFKADPLSPLAAYWNRYVITGFGLFTEGYALFSVGNLSGLFSSVWPACFASHAICDENWLAAVTYLQIIGIICGQVFVGIEGDWIGRRVGLVQDALVMFLGLIMLTAMWGTSLNGWVICYAWSNFIYGFGVGGEYPMTSTSALEYKAAGGSHAKNQTDDKLHRGRNVVLAFLMQGWGQMLNQGVLIILLLITNHSIKPPYAKTATQWTFRLSFAIMAVMTLWLAYYRYYKMKYSSIALMRSKRAARVNQSGYDVASLKAVLGHFPGRLVGTAGCWFANDVAFYGNKLFQTAFLKALYPGAKGVGTTWVWNLLNIGVSLCGYYLAAMLIDHKLYGRQRMQSVGFFATWLLFFLPAVAYNYFHEAGHIRGFQAVYYLSSFFQQFGPNCTTFLLAAEVYPVNVRATAHGFGAACGKLGALLPAVLYNYIDDRTKFWVVCWFGLFGFFLSVVFIPDTTGLDLREQETYWSFVRQGRAHDYHGPAVHRRHLSLWEIYALKRHLAYNPELDRQDKIEALREEYKARKAEMADEKNSDAMIGEDVLSGNASSFFANEEKAGHELTKAEKPPQFSRLTHDLEM